MVFCKDCKHIHAYKHPYQCEHKSNIKEVNDFYGKWNKHVKPPQIKNKRNNCKNYERKI